MKGERRYLIKRENEGTEPSKWSNGVKYGVYIFSLVASISFIAVLTVTFTGKRAETVNTNNLKLAGQTQSGKSRDFQDFTVLGGRSGIQKRESPEEEPIVRIRRQGRIKGTILQSRQGKDYNAFYKVPYGAEPVENLRFEEARSLRRWRGVRDGSQIGTECIQKDKYAPTNTSDGEEGCLHLNIYTPNLPQRREKLELPCLLYIHGGGSYGNGTRYGAKYFMDEPVVLITIEYRLGAFGSFTTGTGYYPGNQEYKDQILALKWIQKNIDRFGGDPKRVLIFGNSSGSSAVQAHLMSPMSQGLFHRGIMQSGTMIAKGQMIQNPLQLSHKLAGEMGCSNDSRTFNETQAAKDETKLIDCLRKIDAKVIALNPTNLDMSGFAVEPLPEDGDMSHVFLADKPWNLFHPKDGITKIVNQVPLIVGVNSMEMMHGPLTYPLLTENGTKFMNDHWNKILPPFLKLQDDVNNTMAKKFYDVYFGQEKISNDTRVRLFDLASDATVHSSRISGLFHANQTNAPVYFYRLSKLVPKSYAEAIKSIFPPPYGVAHADELQYLFLYAGYPEITMESEWFNFSKMMVSLWSSFAANGDPSIPTVQWPPIDLKDNGMKWMDLNDEPKIIEPFTDRMTLWDDYTQQLYAFN